MNLYMSYWLIMGDVDFYWDTTCRCHGFLTTDPPALITIQQLSQDDLRIHPGGVHLTRDLPSSYHLVMINIAMENPL